MGEAIEGWPHRSDYKDTFRAPESRSLAGAGGESVGKVRSTSAISPVATHAIPPPFIQRLGEPEPHQRISVGSGCALNAFAYDNTEMSRGKSHKQKASEQSHYKTTFLPKDTQHTVHALADGTVASPRPIALHQRLLAQRVAARGQHAQRGGSLSPRLRDDNPGLPEAVADAPVGPRIPTRAIARPHTVGRTRDAAREARDASSTRRSVAR